MIHKAARLVIIQEKESVSSCGAYVSFVDYIIGNKLNKNYSLHETKHTLNNTLSAY